ncbi:MAG TPA: ankyrin repeat domain-containing protein [Thermoanaerobaculia bacterium]|nr:ankyrin repeat domain-containing protein [Thermoanaerobaculia bacterium]
MIFEFVRAAHDNLRRVKELLRKEPRLVKASWNWGCGDWETAQGAAGHMGNKEALEFLLSEGAEMDIFCAATLGKVEVVEPLVATCPELAKARGPHGIPLIEHARAGEQDEMVELLRYYGAA